jgi:glycosyltransferase involved in cell wall biosynthesis
MKVAFLTTDVREFYKNYTAPEPSFGTAPEALLQGFAQFPKDVEVHVISCLRQRAPAGAQLAANIHYHGIHVHTLGWGKSLYAGCILAVRQKLREIQPDIAHGQGTERDCAICAILSGFPSVVTIHGNMRQVAKALKAPRYSAVGITASIEQWTVSRATGVVCLSHYTKQLVQDIARKTWIVPNAVDQSFFDVQRVPGKKNTILCIANILPYKNQTALIRALDPVAESNGIRVVFIGDAGKNLPYAEEFLSLVQARPWCVHLGFQSPEVLKNELSGAQLLMLPSLEDNCPMVLLEAAAVGTPIAASNVGGIPDLIEHGETGLLFDPGSPEEMRQCALRLLNDVPYAERLAAAGKKRARERFHPVQIARRHLEIYREVCKSEV